MQLLTSEYDEDSGAPLLTFEATEDEALACDALTGQDVTLEGEA